MANTIGSMTSVDRMAMGRLKSNVCVLGQPVGMFGSRPVTNRVRVRNAGHESLVQRIKFHAIGNPIKA